MNFSPSLKKPLVSNPFSGNQPSKSVFSQDSITFSGRYNAVPSAKKKDQFTKMELASMVSGGGMVVSTIALEPLMIPKAIAVMAPISKFLLPLSALGAAAYVLLPDGKKKPDVSTPEGAFNKEEATQQVKTALETLEKDRKHQIELRNNIVASFKEEDSKLKALKLEYENLEKQAEKLLNPGVDSPVNTDPHKASQLHHAMENLEQRIEDKAKFVATMKSNADAALFRDSKLEADYQTLKEEYLKIQEQINEIDRAHQVEMMQKELEEHAHTQGEQAHTGETSPLKDKIETQFHESMVKIQEALSRTKDLEATLMADKLLSEEQLRTKTDGKPDTKAPAPETTPEAEPKPPAA
ncbi:MAG: hypothetical protein K2X66_18890 [Cyanobacteria bacterium]|nr:hypothetical protein [Cyanobacteriota bacterium]